MGTFTPIIVSDFRLSNKSSHVPTDLKRRRVFFDQKRLTMDRAFLVVELGTDVRVFRFFGATET